MQSNQDYTKEEFEALKLKYKEKIIDGKQMQVELLQQLKEKISTVMSVRGDECTRPTLACILVGNKDSEMYVRSKELVCEEIGIECKSYNIPLIEKESTNQSELALHSQEKIIELIREINRDERVHGILVQLPLPDYLSEKTILDEISLSKDVDGFHPLNIGMLALKGREPSFISCTPKGVLTLLKSVSPNIEGLNVTICGKSNILLLLNEGCTVTVCHSKTQNIKDHISKADVVVAAIGCKGFIKSDWLKEAAIVIDVGINVGYDKVKKEQANQAFGDKEQKESTTQYTDTQQEVEEYEYVRRVYGDVEFSENTLQKCSFITPVPGGVGPMTIAMLMQNVVTSWLREIGQQ